MQLPEGVQIVRKPNGRVYYYHAPGRGTKHAGKRVALGSDARDPEFWQRLRPAGTAGTFNRLITEYKASPEWAALRPRTQRDYESYLDRLAREAGDRPVRAMTRPDVYAMRDGMAATPVASNHMLSVLQTLIEFGVPRGYREDNPVLKVKRLRIEGDGAAPWPEEGYRFVLAHAPPDLLRMAFLGRATGQRAGDLVRMRPADLDSDGMRVRIGKRRELKHFVPLTVAEMARIRSWNVEPMDLFIKSTRGRRYSATHLNSRWNRWRESVEAQPVRDLKMTIHGLRATKIADLDGKGLSDREISAEVGISAQMVARYLRFADKAKAGRASRDRREAG